MTRLVGILEKSQAKSSLAKSIFTKRNTSNETSTPSSSSVCVVMNLAKLVELLTWCSELQDADKVLRK